MKALADQVIGESGQAGEINFLAGFHGGDGGGEDAAEGPALCFGRTGFHLGILIFESLIALPVRNCTIAKAIGGGRRPPLQCKSKLEMALECLNFKTGCQQVSFCCN
jgi:hypothetical protein